MPEELNSCSCFHVTGFRKPQPPSQPAWGIRLRKHCPPVSPKPLHVPSWALQAFQGQWGSTAGTGALLGLDIMFSACGCAAGTPASHRKLLRSPGTPLSIVRTHTHAHTVHCIFLIISANHPPGCSDRWSCLTSAQRNDKPVSSSSQPDTHPPPRFIPTTARFCSQQTITALSQNLPVLMVIRSRLGTAGTLRAGVLWHPAWT